MMLILILFFVDFQIKSISNISNTWIHEGVAVTRYKENDSLEVKFVCVIAVAIEVVREQANNI